MVALATRALATLMFFQISLLVMVLASVSYGFTHFVLGWGWEGFLAFFAAVSALYAFWYERSFLHYSTVETAKAYQAAHPTFRIDEEKVSNTHRMVGDVLCDPIVELFPFHPPLHAPTLTTLKSKLESKSLSPAMAVSVRRFIEEVEVVPDWLDPALLHHACTFYHENMVAFLLGQMVGLIESYSFPVDASVLFKSGGLSTSPARTLQRLVETLAFVNSVCTPTGPVPGTDGHNICINVRIYHAIIRARCLEDWDVAAHDIPINEASVVGTLFFFSHVPIEMLKKRGERVTELDERATWHLWRYVGWLLGASLDAIPQNYGEGLVFRLSSVYLRFQHPNEYSRFIVASALEVISMVPGMELPVWMHSGTVREFLGHELSDQLGVVRLSLWQRVIHRLLLFLISNSAWVAITVPPIRALRTRLFTSMVTGAMADVLHPIDGKPYGSTCPYVRQSGGGALAGLGAQLSSHGDVYAKLRK